MKTSKKPAVSRAGGPRSRSSRTKASIVPVARSHGRLTRLNDLAGQLGHDEIKIVEDIMERLIKIGLPQYGFLDLKNTKRDFAKMADEELLDVMFYMPIELRKRGLTHG